MKLGETTAALRRIEFTILLADGSDLASAVDGFTSPSPTVLIAQNNNTLVAAGGTFGHSTGETKAHYYEATAGEALVPGFLLVVITHPLIQDTIVSATVGQTFKLGGTNTALLRWPVTIYNTAQPPALATGATVTSASDLQSSVNAGAFANDPGSLVEIGHGAYYWQATTAAVATPGFVTMRYLSAGFGLCLSWVSVDDPTGVATAAPRILMTIQLADGSDLASGVDALAPTVLVASNNNTLGAATGTLATVSGESKLHVYVPSVAEAAGTGFLLVIVMHASIQTTIAWIERGQIFKIGETDPTRLRLPIAIYDTTPALSTGATVTTASDLKSSINAGAFADDAGSLVEIGHGAYYWQATAAAAAVAGFATVRYLSTGFSLLLAWVGVEPEAVIGVGNTLPIFAPAAIAAPPLELTSHVPVIVMIDLALRRLPHQYRGTNG